MRHTYTAPDCDDYRMAYRDPYRELEPLNEERRVVGDVLRFLSGCGVLEGTEYPRERLLAHRQAVRRLFEVPWTAISPRMERLIYALNALSQPRNMVAAGVFCGFTFICNAGAAVGPGRCYDAADLVGVEIQPERAKKAEENVRRIDSTGVARVVAADALEFVASYDGPVDLLYLDADGAGGAGKAIYLDILQAALGRMPPGALVLAHNSYNSATELEDYLSFVRDGGRFRQSVNVLIDPEGLEVTLK